ncbi:MULTISPECIES: hypothetical protein [unclassified Mesorhizobium]|nr:MULTISPECIES: hypothetical protein [unclassified Mesorhizobium]
MRTLLVLISLAASFAVWDRLANNGVFVAAMERSIKQVAERLTG